MPILKSGGEFQVVLPDGWEATKSPGEPYSIEPTDGSSFAITISVYDRPPKRGPGSVTTEHLARDFAEYLGAADAANLEIVTVKSWRQERSFAGIVVDDVAWFIGCLFLGNTYVLASANSDAADTAGLARCENVISSIAPA